MLEKGQTPPGIRHDIIDEPPNPSALPSGARLKPRPKPWERAASATDSAATNGALSPGAGQRGFPFTVISLSYCSYAVHYIVILMSHAYPSHIRLRCVAQRFHDIL